MTALNKNREHLLPSNLRSDGTAILDQMLLTLGRLAFMCRGELIVSMPESSEEHRKSNEGFGLEWWRARQDLNPRPSAPKACTTEC